MVKWGRGVSASLVSQDLKGPRRSWRLPSGDMSQKTLWAPPDTPPRTEMGALPLGAEWPSRPNDFTLVFREREERQHSTTPLSREFPSVLAMVLPCGIRAGTQGLRPSKW